MEAEEGGEGLHPLAGPLRRLARVPAAARRSRRHRARGRQAMRESRAEVPKRGPVRPASQATFQRSPVGPCWA